MNAALLGSTVAPERDELEPLAGALAEPADEVAGEVALVAGELDAEVEAGVEAAFDEEPPPHAVNARAATASNETAARPEVIRGTGFGPIVSGGCVR
jgi:hypothetical protein